MNKTEAAKKIQVAFRKRRVDAAKKIQRAFKSRRISKLPFNVKNAIMNTNLGPIAIESQNKPGGVKHYMNPNTFKHFLKNGKYINPRTRQPANFRLRRIKYTGKGTTGHNNTNNILKQSKNISNKITQMKKNKPLIPNNRIGQPNYEALAWTRNNSSNSNNNNSNEFWNRILQVRPVTTTGNSRNYSRYNRNSNRYNMD